MAKRMNDLCDGFLATRQNKRLAPACYCVVRGYTKQQAGLYLTPFSAALRWGSDPGLDLRQHDVRDL
jgi:hypothetical protein